MITEHPKTIVAYGELPRGSRYPCDARRTIRKKQERSHFGKRSALSYSSTCRERAIVRVLFADGSIANRCKNHYRS